MKIRGRVKAISVKDRRYAFLVGDHWASLFLREETPSDVKRIIKSIKEGDEVEFEAEYKKTSTWEGYNIRGFYSVRGEKYGEFDTEWAEKSREKYVQPVEQKEEITPPEETTERRREASIVLQCIIKAAAQVVASEYPGELELKLEAWERCIKRGMLIYKEIMGE